MIRPVVLFALVAFVGVVYASDSTRRQPEFQTSDRCVACHNGLLTASGEDVSIGFDWRASIMANSSRDPYWLASVRRETMDHPVASAEIEDECAVCHMPIPRYEAKLRGEYGRVFAHLPFAADEKQGRQAADGVSCGVCHQISTERLGRAIATTGAFSCSRRLSATPGRNTDRSKLNRRIDGSC